MCVNIPFISIFWQTKVNSIASVKEMNSLLKQLRVSNAELASKNVMMVRSAFEFISFYNIYKRYSVLINVTGTRDKLSSKGIASSEGQI